MERRKEPNSGGHKEEKQEEKENNHQGSQKEIFLQFIQWNRFDIRQWGWRWWGRKWRIELNWGTWRTILDL